MRVTTQKRRGLSLPEIIAVLALLAILVGLSLARHGSERSRAESSGLANEMLAEVRQARALARSTGESVAVCFPAGPGPHSQSFYILQGISQGRPARVRDFAQTYPNSYLAIGAWGSDLTTTRPIDDLSPTAPNIWLPSEFSDFALIFAPDGSVSSNDLPLCDGRYKILVSSALEYSSSGVTGDKLMTTPPDYYSISRAAGARVIEVTPGGEIVAQDGASGLAIEAHPFPLANPPAPAFALTAPAAGTPEIKSLAVTPEPPEGEDATVTRDGSLTIWVTGIDPGGDDLFLEWSATLNTGSASYGGNFSQASRYRMQWDASRGVWSSEVTWRPPHDAAVGDTFDISCELSNSTGVSVAGSSAELKEIVVIDDNKFVLNDDDGLYSVSENGVALKRLMSHDRPKHVQLSPDGSKITFEGGGWDRAYAYVANVDGTNLVRLPMDHRSVYSYRPVWNHIGTKLFYPLRREIRCIRPDGTGDTAVSIEAITDLQRVYRVIVSPDGRYLAMIAAIYRTPGDRDTYSTEIFIGRLDQSVNPPAITGWTNLTEAERPWWPSDSNSLFLFHPQPPDSSSPIIVTRGIGRGGSDLYTFQVNDPGPGSPFTSTLSRLNLASGRPARHLGICFSPDGTEAATVDWYPTRTITRYTWDTTSGTPRLTGERIIKNNTNAFRQLDWY